MIKIWDDLYYPPFTFCCYNKNDLHLDLNSCSFCLGWRHSIVCCLPVWQPGHGTSAHQAWSQSQCLHEGIVLRFYLSNNFRLLLFFENVLFRTSCYSSD